VINVENLSKNFGDLKVLKNISTTINKGEIMSNIHLAIATDFTLAEKLLEALEQKDLSIDKISAIELEPFGEEQNLRFGTKAVEQFELDNLDWSQFTHVLFAAPMAQAEILAKSPTSIRMLKFAMNLTDDGMVGQQVFAGEATRLAYMTDEAKEGRDAFLQKRKPNFEKKWIP